MEKNKKAAAEHSKDLLKKKEEGDVKEVEKIEK